MLNRYMEIKKKMAELDSELDTIKAALYVEAVFNGKDSCTFEKDGFKIRIQKKENVKVDQDKAKLHPNLFKVKYEYNAKLAKDNEAIVNECITTSVGKPSFTVEKLDE